MKLTEASNPIPDSLYLNFSINMLHQEFDTLVNTVNNDLSTVEEVISNIHQMEIQRSLHTENDGMAFATQKRGYVARTLHNVQGARHALADVSIAESTGIGQELPKKVEYQWTPEYEESKEEPRLRQQGPTWKGP